MKTRTFLLMGSFLLLAAAAPQTPEYRDHARVMIYLDESGQEQPVKTPADWAIRRKHILAGMQQAMGPLPDLSHSPPLDPRETGRIEQDGVVRISLSFVAEDKDRVTAHLYLPGDLKPGERRAAMLALHPTGAQGKDIVAGLGKANRGYGLELARRGYVVLAPDYPSFGDLANYDFAADKYVSGTMKGIVNHIRSVDLLQSRPEVDPERIGVIGHSLGGHNAMFVGVFDERLKVIVSSCGWTPFHDYYEGNIKGWTSDRYMPLLRDKYGLDPDRVPFDFYEVVAALAPRAFFSSSPVRDSNFEVAGVRRAEPIARAVYRLLGADDRLVVRYPECEHDFPSEVRQEAYEFVDRTLSHTPTR
ncbi:MAG TPA: alpha/beta fold hydrolase [Pirellulales bacterium]|jgi:acetyl esterase/lipase|nr:alpha/beta fold hydrolase [Pirellulales bacterium]